MSSKRIFAVFLLLASTGCGSGVSWFSPAAGVSFDLKLASENTVVSSVKPRGERTVVSSSTSGLSSLQLFVKSITICLNLTVSQSQFSAGLNCGTLYTGPAGLDQTSASTDQSPLAAQAATTSSNFTDLMSDSARKSLGQSAGGTSLGAGSYNWGYVEWAPPIKIAATLLDTSGNPYFFTEPGATTGTNSGSGYTYVTQSSTSFTSGSSAQTAVILEPNAGSWFRLLSPFTIQQTDVVAQTSFVIDLVFDPVGFATGADSNVAGSVLFDGTNSIQVPTPVFLPIEHSPNDTVMKESYVVSDTSSGFDIHLDLYYVQSDSAKTIRAAGIRAIPNSGTASPITGAMNQVAFIRQNPGGTTDFLDYANNPILTGLTRGTASQVTVACTGEAQTTTFDPLPLCSSAGEFTETFQSPTTASLN